LPGLAVALVTSFASTGARSLWCVRSYKHPAPLERKLSCSRSVLILLNQSYGKLLAIMSTAKQEVESLLSKLPDDCSLEDIQYHLYVIEKVRNGLEAADSQVSQGEVERRVGKWLTE
jgi:hypothetical protein